MMAADAYYSYDAYESVSAGAEVSNSNTEDGAGTDD